MLSSEVSECKPLVCGAAAGNTNVSCSRCRAEKYSDVGSQKMWTVSVPPDDRRWAPCTLEVHFPPGCTYPAEPPLVSVQQSNLPPALRRSMAAALAALAASLAGAYTRPPVSST
jgi:hypothetical protein